MADNSTNSTNLQFYGDDNKATYQIGDTSWNPFDMVYYKNKIFKAYFGFQSDTHVGDVRKICYYWHDPAMAPQESPNQEILPNTNDVTAFRFVILNSQLYLILAQQNGDSFKLHYKKFVSMGVKPSDDSWTGRTEIHEDSGEVRGLLTAAFSDGVYIMYQKKGYGYVKLLIFDGTKVTDKGQAFNFSDFDDGLENSCILNSDVFYRQSDGQQCLAIVTKDDAYQRPEGVCGLFVYDPSANSLNPIAQLPGLSGDVAVAYGNVEGCTPYSKNNIQIWCLGWTDQKLKHIQYTFAEDALSGTFHDAYWNNICDPYPDAKCSSHDSTDKRGYLSAKLSVSMDPGDSKSLITNIWVWWYGHTETYVHGRSFKYKSNYLIYKQTESYDTTPDGPGPSWQLLGMIMGYPPFYPNGYSGTPLNNIFIQYGRDESNSITTAGMGEASFGISLGKGFGPPETPFASIGFSIAVGFAQTLSQTTSLEESFYTTFSASNSEWDSKTAWGIFLVPWMCNDLYELTAPDRETDMDYELYYMYINSEYSHIDYDAFDMTSPSGSYYNGIKTADGQEVFPASTDYEAWHNSACGLSPESCDDYEMLFVNSITGGGGGGSQKVTISETTLGNSKNSTTLKITVSAKFFGFGTDDSITVDTSTALCSTVNDNMTVSCGLPPCDNSNPDPGAPSDPGKCLSQITDRFYLMNANTTNCFWIPDSCKDKGMEQLPWCLTWYVTSFDKCQDQDPSDQQ
ncbi:MAG: hypothetical protein PVH61_39690 [Candidatus Aminicenantes bacterium]|jgi:hypothetical protein